MPRRSLLVAVAVALVVVLLWYMFLWRPTSSSLTKARGQADTAERERDDLQDQLRRLRSAQRQEPLKLSQLATLKVAVPDDPNLAQFILDANDAATKSGIDFLSISPTPPGAGAAAGTTATTTAGAAGGAAPVAIRLAMTIQGGYFQVIDFLNTLDKLSRVVVIDSLSISGATGGPLSVSLTARMFVANAAPVAGSVTTTTAPGATTTTAPGATTTTVAGATTTSRPPGAP
jgi:Tfp pilus assembly protein PilO